ncbi:MAG: IMP dehydrogenase, partial [Mycoplasmatales bacterium]
MKEYLTFDDVLLLPNYSDIDVQKISVDVELTPKIKLFIPFCSAAMDTVTESKLAISMSLNGGIGIIHKNFSLEEQVAEVVSVKEFKFKYEENIYSLPDDVTLQVVKDKATNLGLSQVIIINQKQEVTGIITQRDLSFIDLNMSVKDFLVDKKVVYINKKDSSKKAYDLMLENSITKIIVVDDFLKLVGITTLKQIEELDKYTNSAVDGKNRLLCGAAISTSEDALERANALIDAGLDMLVIDSAHGNSKRVIDLVSKIRELGKEIVIVAGNVVTPDAVINLAKAGADIIKVGIGSGSICTTRVISGVGSPQLSAVMECSEAAKKVGVKIIADGGIKYSGDIVKALAAGADVVMLGSMLSGHEESPGEKIISNDKVYKSYIGMGSLKAMKRGGGERYFQAKNKKYVPEGVEALVEYKGFIDNTLYQLVGGLKSGLGYNGAENLIKLHKNAKF